LEDYKENNFKQFPRYLTTILDFLYEENSIIPNSITKKEYNFMNYFTESNGKLPQEFSAGLLLLLKENKESYILKEKTSTLDVNEITNYEKKFLFFKKEVKSLDNKIDDKNLYICDRKIYNEVFDILKNSDSEVIS